ncbi:MAG: thiamine diphosphokinase [Bacteroidaceae bacterium]|nr:thiamine diphosphokinase [Bacteroidaceae bacterium]
MNTQERDYAVILAKGEYPTADTPTKILSEASFVVCCDGAANNYIKQGFTPDAIIGDGDSLHDSLRTQYSHLVHKIEEQETNDLTKAVRFLLSKGKKEIVILGATGRREDHTLGNISLLMSYARKGINVRMYTNYGAFIPCKDSCTIGSYRGQQISIINFGATSFSSEGLLYPIYDFSEWWQGTLNEATGDSFTINAKGEYLIFLNY